MAINYFAGLTSEQEINRVYKPLCIVFHPDNGGDAATMQEINRQRAAALEALKAGSTDAETGEILEIPAAVIGLPEKSETTTSLQDEIKRLIDKVQEIPGLHLELCGEWLWVTGNTKPVKDQVKKLGFRWSHNKAAWYWRDPRKPYRRRGRRRYSMDEIRERHGSQQIA